MGAIQIPRTVAQLIRPDAPASAARAALGLGSVATHDASEFAPAGGGGSPGGSSGQLQYNNAGAFGGAAGVTYAASATIFQAQAQATGDVPLVAKGFSVGQTGNLQQWQASDGTALLQVNSDGGLSRQDGANFQIKGAGSIDIYCGNVFDFRLSHSTTIGFQPQADNVHPLGGAANRWSVLCAGQVQALCADAGTTPELVKGAASQTANLAEWQKSDATVYGTVSENGYFTTRKNSAPADAELTAGEAAWWFDSTNGSAKLKVKAKQANGTVVVGEIALT